MAHTGHKSVDCMCLHIQESEWGADKIIIHSREFRIQWSPQGRIQGGGVLRVLKPAPPLGYSLDNIQASIDIASTSTLPLLAKKPWSTPNTNLTDKPVCRDKNLLLRFVAIKWEWFRKKGVWPKLFNLAPSLLEALDPLLHPMPYD